MYIRTFCLLCRGIDSYLCTEFNIGTCQFLQFDQSSVTSKLFCSAHTFGLHTSIGLEAGRPTIEFTFPDSRFITLRISLVSLLYINKLFLRWSVLIWRHRLLWHIFLVFLNFSFPYYLFYPISPKTVCLGGVTFFSISIRWSDIGPLNLNHRYLVIYDLAKKFVFWNWNYF